MRTPVILLALSLIAPLADGCTSGKHAIAQDAATSSLTAAAGGTLAEADLRYGVAPTRNSDVEYQTDVIIPGGGAQAVRSASADGLTWNIDANAPGAADLVPGRSCSSPDAALAASFMSREMATNSASRSGRWS